MTEPRFKSGDIVYVADWDLKKNWVTCPVCFGDKEIKVILGNGTEVMTECRYCQQGFEPPRGKVVAGYIRLPSVKQEVVTKVALEIEIEETKATYWFGSHGRTGDAVYLTEEEALEYANKRIEELDQKDAEEFLTKKAKPSKSYGWHVGYHLRNAESDYRSYLHHINKARVMGEQARPKKIVTVTEEE